MATPVIVLTKSDLCDDLEEKLAKTESVAIGIDILVTSSITEDGYESIMPYIQKGHTIAFIGSSGVGKTSLINRLIGDEAYAVNGLRDDDKGRHTTTKRELVILDSGAIVVDTPGMRMLGLEGADIDKTFGDIDEISLSCRFKDCNHDKEPGCAIKEAIASGELPKERFMSYLKLKKEYAHYERKMKLKEMKAK